MKPLRLIAVLYGLFALLAVGITSPSLSEATEQVPSEIVWNYRNGRSVPVDPYVSSILLKHYQQRQFKGIDVKTTFGKETRTVYTLMAGMTNRMIAKDMDHVRGMTERQLAGKIQAAASEYIKSLGSISENLRVFLNGQAYFDWLRTHVRFDASVDEGKYVGEERKKRFEFASVFGMEQPSSVCGFYSWNASYLACLAGFPNIQKIEGTSQWLADKSKVVHSWNILTLPDGTVCFSDITQGAISLEEARKRDGLIFTPHSLPIESLGQGFFLATHFSHTIVQMSKQSNGDWKGQIIKQDRDPFMALTTTEWDMKGDKVFDAFRKNFSREASGTVWTR